MALRLSVDFRESARAQLQPKIRPHHHVGDQTREQTSRRDNASARRKGRGAGATKRGRAQGAPARLETPSSICECHVHAHAARVQQPGLRGGNAQQAATTTNPATQPSTIAANNKHSTVCAGQRRAWKANGNGSALNNRGPRRRRRMSIIIPSLLARAYM